MASSAPAQATNTPPQQPRGRGRGLNEESSQSSVQGGDQPYFPKSRNRENPSHKKGWQQRSQRGGNPQEGSNFNGNHQETRGKGRNREQEEYNEANGSPTPPIEKREEYRGKKGRGSQRDLNGAHNGNANGGQYTPKSDHSNGTPHYPPHLESRIEESKRINAIVQQELKPEESKLVLSLVEIFPKTPRDEIIATLRKNHFDRQLCLEELSDPARNSGNQSWTEVVKNRKKASTPQESNGRRDEPGQQRQPPQQVVLPTSQQAQPPAQPQPQQPPQRHQRHQHSHQQSQQHLPPPLQQQQLHPPQPDFVQQPTQQLHTVDQQQQPQPAPTQQDHIQYQYAPAFPIHHHQHLQHQPQPEAPFFRGDDMLSGLSKAIELQLAEVQRKTNMLSQLKNELDAINNSDKDQRAQLEAERSQLESDRQKFRQELQKVEERLMAVEDLIKHAEAEKTTKVSDLYKNFHSHGLLSITNG